MKKNNLLGCVIFIILFIVYNAVAFVVPFDKTIGFWMGYGFGAIAFIFQIFTFKSSFIGGHIAKSKFYGFPIVKISVVYLIIQMVISLLCMIFAVWIPDWIIFLLNVIVLSAAAIGCISADIMKNEVIRQDIDVQSKTSFMKNLQMMSALIVGQCYDEKMKNIVRKLSEELKYSDPVSCPESIVIEREIEQKLKELQQAAANNDEKWVEALCEKLMQKVNERNAICKLNK